jgi:hypothetical protein
MPTTERVVLTFLIGHEHIQAFRVLVIISIADIRGQLIVRVRTRTRSDLVRIWPVYPENLPRTN